MTRKRPRSGAPGLDQRSRNARNEDYLAVARLVALASAEYRAITAKAWDARRHRNALLAQLEALTAEVTE